MRREILILLGILLISFTSANSHSSTTEVDFSIEGCNFDFEGESVSVAIGTCSGGEASGEFFCDSNSYGWITRDVGLGCSKGQDSYETGDDFCCPSGYFCNETSGGERFQCDRRLEDCINQLYEDDCETEYCIWLNITNECVDSIDDFSCEYYTDELSCSDDIYNIGQYGVGTELCDTTIGCNSTTFTIPRNGCTCQWYSPTPEVQVCQIKLIGVQMFSETGTDPIAFGCSNSYNLGNCTNGRQNVSWISNSSVINGSWISVPQDCLDALGCNGGESERRCGEPIIKLSGFSLFSLFVSLGIVGLYYFLRKD